MPLFQRTIIKKHLLELNNKEIDSAYGRFTAYFHNPTIQSNIRNSKEEQFQEGFLRELFGHVLNYTLNPNPGFNLTTELKNTTNSKKVDGAIVINDKAIAVIELKGTDTTDLSKIETQAFGYKNNQSECTYVITSNFEKLRFYIDNTIDYEEFNLFTLTRDQFNLLYLCLSFENIKDNVPKRLKMESVSQEDQITKKLYKDYSDFKRALFSNLVELNPGYDKLLLFKKTQKLLDRFLFILFAEDRLLLPTNLIFRINQEWKNLVAARVPVSLYDRYKMYFDDLNHGAKVTLPAFGKKTGDAITAEFEIFAYNGGLFQPDEILDNVKIDDALLHTYSEKLSHYDFDSDVDVNILGHIFENSLNEIDEIKAELEGHAVEKTKTKRKKDGVFYTPKYITKYIVDNTVGKLCEEKKAELDIKDEYYINDKKQQARTKKALLDKLSEYRKWLLDLTICDPACGSGAFLNQALEFLISEHRYVDELQAKMMGDAMILSDVETSILENNIYGVDLNDESVEIAKLSLWLRTAQKGRKLNSLNNNIKCGNSLIDDPKVADEKAFSWEKEFPEVFAKGGFDVVIGNPPYGATLNDIEKKFIVETYKSYQYKFDTYIYFYELSLKILKTNGFLGYITPELFLRLDKSENIRKLLLENVLITVIKLCGENVFQDVKVNSVVLIFSKTQIDDRNKTSFIVENQAGNCTSYSYFNWEKTSGHKIEFEVTNEAGSIINKIEKASSKLGDLGSAIQGLTPYDSYRGHSKELIKNREFHSKSKINETYGKWLEGKHLNRYIISEGEEWLKYGDWLAAPRTPEYFEGPRLLFREIPGGSKRIQAAFTSEKYYYGHSITPFILKNRENTDLLFLILGVVNSKLLSFYASKMISNFSKDTFPKLNPKDIKELPIIRNLEKSDQLIKLVKSLMTYHETQRNNVAKFTNYLLSQTEIEKLPTKLINWNELAFTEFIKEINKVFKGTKGTVLTKKDEFEWMELFEENKKKIIELNTEIDKTDREIDQLVYMLYGLSEDEIKIVEGV